MQRYKVGSSRDNHRFRYIMGIGDFDVFWGGASIPGLYVKWSKGIGNVCRVSDYSASGGPVPLHTLNVRLNMRQRMAMTPEEYEVLCAVNCFIPELD